LAAAAVRADVVEREVRPALEAGEIVVIDRFLGSPLIEFGSPDELDGHELHSLTNWATGRLRPDVTVLLDRAPSDGPAGTGHRAALAMGEEHLRVQRWLTRMAAAEPHRYVVVDADADPEIVEDRVRAEIRPLVGARPAKRRPSARQPR
jgi:dTMP kinase